MSSMPTPMALEVNHTYRDKEVSQIRLIIQFIPNHIFISRYKLSCLFHGFIVLGVPQLLLWHSYPNVVLTNIILARQVISTVIHNSMVGWLCDTRGVFRHHLHLCVYHPGLYNHPLSPSPPNPTLRLPVEATDISIVSHASQKNLLGFRIMSKDVVIAVT